jgi:hypothetical protein
MFIFVKTLTVLGYFPDFERMDIVVKQSVEHSTLVYFCSRSTKILQTIAITPLVC